MGRLWPFLIRYNARVWCVRYLMYPGSRATGKEFLIDFSIDSLLSLGKNRFGHGRKFPVDSKTNCPKSLRLVGFRLFFADVGVFWASGPGAVSVGAPLGAVRACLAASARGSASQEYCVYGASGSELLFVATESGRETSRSGLDASQWDRA